MRTNLQCRSSEPYAYQPYAYQPYNVDLRNKVSFDIQPTNPQADITATGHCEYWITTIDLMEYQEKSTLSSPDDTMLPEVYTDTVACINNVDGKCKGMLIPERLHIPQKVFDKAKCSGLHGHIKSLPISFRIRARRPHCL